MLKAHTDLNTHQNLAINGVEISIDITCGASLGVGEMLYQQASSALKLSRQVDDDLVLYSDNLNRNSELESNIYWNKQIKEAILNNRIVPFFQPIYDNKLNKITKYEALVRLIDTDGVVHSPFRFLELSKKSKQYKEITKEVIKHSIQMFKNLDSDFSINISYSDIANPKIVAYLREQIEEYAIGERVIIEIVESESISKYDAVKSFIDNMKMLGCKISIDDFGSGYSNFSHILELEVNFLKIDGSLIQNVASNKNSEIIVKSIIMFAKSIGIKTVAEFVSSKEIFEKVKELGIDYSQGYYIGAPQQTPQQEPSFE